MFCPEDGTKVEPKEESSVSICYDCPGCGTHWTYDAHVGAYFAVMPGDTCIACERRVPCLAATGGTGG